MPISTDSGAAAAAHREVEIWARIAARWNRSFIDSWHDRVPEEAELIVGFDPRDDLQARARSWGHRVDGFQLSDLASFAAGLAATEAEAWTIDDPPVATRAYEARRFLLGDRILHWVVPWLDAVGRCYPRMRRDAHSDRDALLTLGDLHRPVPRLSGNEGRYPPGEDSFGPVGDDSRLDSLRSGAVILSATSRSLSGKADVSPCELSAGGSASQDVAGFYEVTSVGWLHLAEEHPGSAALWFDLAERARRTASRIQRAALVSVPGRDLRSR